MNILDIVILAALVISVIYGMRRGFISGVLSVAALIGSAVLALMFSGRLAQWLQGNQTLVDTLIYYTDAGSRIRSVDMAMLRISQISQEMMSRIVEAANLPETFGRLFAASIASAAPEMTVSELLSQTIVGMSIAILSFLICFTAAYLALGFLIRLIEYVFEFPVLRHLDALMGGVFGLARGVLLVFIFFSLVPLALAVAPIEPVKAVLETSKLAAIFDSRIILTIVNGKL